MLGNIYGDAGDLDRALKHYREAIRYEKCKAMSTAQPRLASTSPSASLNAGRFPDALAYAQAALRNYETFGDRAAAEIQKTQGLIARDRAGHAVREWGVGSREWEGE